MSHKCASQFYAAGEASTPDQWVRVFDVSHPTRHQKGYTVYKVTSKVFPKNSIEAVTQVVVWKRFSDFKKLHKGLSVLHASLHLKGTFPKFSKDRIFGRFDRDVIEERRQSALHLLEFAAQHPPLFTSQIFVKFFQDGQTVSGDEVQEVKDDLPEPLHPVKVQPDAVSILSESSDVSFTDSSWSESVERPRECEELSTSQEGEKPKPELLDDLSAFDPLRLSDMDADSVSVSSSSNWWAAALEACVRLEPSPPQDGQEMQRILEYPKPFADDPELDTFDPLKAASATNNEDQEQLPPLSPFPPELRNESKRNYLLEAANLISQAQQSEVSAQMSAAFSFYKAAVGILLEGVQGETDATKREAVRRKTAQYLMRAEDIYNRCIRMQEDAHKDIGDVFVPETLLDSRAESLRGPLTELARYRLLGIVGKVQLILDTHNKQIVVIKTLYKSPNPKPASLSPKSVFPCGSDVPFLVRLIRIFETSYAIFLVLQYATGGRLWDYIKSYLTRPASASQCADCLLVDKNDDPANVYAGHNMRGEEDRCSSRESASKSGNNHVSPAESAISVYSVAKSVLERPLVAAKKKESSSSSVNGAAGLTVEQLIVNSRQLISKVEQTMSEVNCGGGDDRPSVTCSSSSLELSCNRMHHVCQLFRQMDGRDDTPHLPEACVRTWIAEMVAAVSQLHALGIVCQDLHPDNILLGDDGHILVTYQYSCSCVDHTVSKSAKENLYAAPEVGGIYPVTPACDWWSVGALAFELLTGRSLSSCYPGGVLCLTSLAVPSHVSIQAHDLLSKLLQPNPSERLGYRGVEEIKAHSFFFDVNWSAIESGGYSEPTSS